MRRAYFCIPLLAAALIRPDAALAQAVPDLLQQAGSDSATPLAGQDRKRLQLREAIARTAGALGGAALFTNGAAGAAGEDDGRAQAPH